MKLQTPEQLAEIREQLALMVYPNMMNLSPTIKRNYDKLDGFVNTLLDHITALEGEKAMERGRRDAKIAVLTSVLAKLAQEGQQEYAQKMLKKSDAAWMDVKPEDLVVAHVSGIKQEQS